MYAEFLRHQGVAVLAFANGGDALKVAPLASVIVTEMRGTIDGAELIGWCTPTNAPGRLL